MAETGDSIGITVFVLTGIAIILNVASIFIKLCKEFPAPKLWKYAWFYEDVTSLILCIGLVLFAIYTYVNVQTVCDITGFFLLFGLFEVLFSHLTLCVILLFIQNPGKPTSLSKFHRNAVIIITVPEIILAAIVSFLPYTSNDLFNTDVPFDVICLPIRNTGNSGSAYGILLLSLLWLILVTTGVLDVISVLKVWTFYNRVNSAQNNVWQTQLLHQGKSAIKISIFNHILCFLLILIITITVYSDIPAFENNRTWIVMTSLAVSAIIHGVFSNISDIMWTSCCCRDNSTVKEPHRKLKKLELVRIEAPGKLRMKATWTVGKHATKRGLMKVYGVDHLKSWAQEIVMLGMLRRTQHPSLIQCLWTHSSNPYYETMTLISGEIVTSDSRIICLELTNGGTLQDFLLKCELPLPEPCQRMIVHDIAEGLFYLHHESILHNNLTTSCIYLKGSLQSMVLRAAVGDFEDAQIYGTLQMSHDSSLRDKKYFFLPDIRSFALIALEIVGKMCEKRFQNRYVNYNTEHVPMKLNLQNVISDEDDEFGAQYGYEAEDTYRMFDAVHPVEAAVESGDSDSGDSDKEIVIQRPAPALKGVKKEVEDKPPVFQDNARNGLTHLGNSAIKREGDDEDDEVAKFINSGGLVSPRHSVGENVITRTGPERVKSPVQRKILASKSRRDSNHSKDSGSDPSARCLSPQQGIPINRCVSPDPMQDEKLQELRNETNSNTRQSKKDRKFSFRRKRSEENVFQKPEAFVKTTDESEGKRKDSNWLSKPQSILKSITSTDTAVSVFKAKHNDEDNHLDAIEEEDISTGQSIVNKPRQIQVKQLNEKPKAEVWDIIDEQYFSQVNRKAAHKLKKTVSSESRASLWSFISTPEDVDDDDDLDGVLECLPGMTQPSDLRKSELKVSDILAEREKADRQEETKKRFSFAEFCKNKSKFELIDYYELLKAKHITLNDVPEDKREMLINVVELKREEKLRKEGKFVPTNVLKNDELYDSSTFPSASNMADQPETPGGKSKLISFRHGQVHSSPHKVISQTETDPRLERARSAPLKRPRTPMHKPSASKPEVNPAFNDTRTVTVAKRNKARAALRKALNNKHQQTFGIQGRERGREIAPSGNVHMKYATIRKINASGDSTDNESKCGDDVLTVLVPTSESFSVTNVKPTDSKDIKRYASFSSNESGSSIVSSVRQRKGDVSLTSGELSSLSSQAESEHFETDGHLTDIETVAGSRPMHTKPIRGPGSKVDSGFDSGSMSSEMSDAFMNRAKQFNGHLNYGSKANTWARNYKMVDAIPNSPYNFTNKFMPPTANPSVFGSKSNQQDNAVFDDSDVHSADSGYAANNRGHQSREKERMKPKMNTAGVQGLSPVTRVMSPSGRIMSSERPMSPHSGSVSKTQSSRYSNARPVSALSVKDRPTSPPSRPMSPASRPMSPASRPLSPNVRPTDTNPLKHLSRPMSPDARPFSPKGEGRRPRKTEQTFAPGRKLAKPQSPQPQVRAKSVPRMSKSEDNTQKHRGRSLSPPSSVKSDTASIASKRYRELVKQGVPMRTSVVDSSPTRQTEDNDHNLKEDVDSRPVTADSMAGRPLDDQELFENLEANGFFQSRPRSRSPYNKSGSPHRTASPNSRSTDKNQSRDKRRHRRKEIPLEEIVREKPTGKAPAHRSPSKNHLAVSEEAFLNQPTSEDSETCSIKTNKSNVSTPSGTKPKVMVDAELVIDRIFSQNQPADNDLDVEVEALLGLDKDPFKAVNELYLNGRSPNPSNLDTMPLLNGMGQKHIHGCMELASGLHVITVRDLLPATQESFTILRAKLQQVGQLGNVGNQLLDVIQKCWLLDMPPSSGDLVEQLTDPVTETEL